MLLAHQGGWDEILLVLTPIALFAGLLWLANSRANRELRRRRAADEAETERGLDAKGVEDATGDEPGAPPPDPSR